MKPVQLLAAAFAVLCALSGTVSAHGAADMPLGAYRQGGDPYAGAAARTVRAIISYTHWADPHDPLVLCVTPGTSHAELMTSGPLGDGRHLICQNVAAQGAGLERCDILYLGNLAISMQRQLISSVRGRGVLTIAEWDPGNASEAMFALTYKSDALSFKMNIDAISRSRIKVDLRVLRLAEGGN